MLSIVDSTAPPIAVAERRGAGNPAVDWDMSTKKLKLGVDAVYTPLYWLGFNGRFDYGAARSRRRLLAHAPATRAAASSTSRCSPRASCSSTQFVTHETVQLQYAHYFLGEGRLPALSVRLGRRGPTRNLVGLFASMWW